MREDLAGTLSARKLRLEEMLTQLPDHLRGVPCATYSTTRPQPRLCAISLTVWLMRRAIFESGEVYPDRTAPILTAGDGGHVLLKARWVSRRHRSFTALQVLIEA